MYFRECPDCGCYLDPGEICDCKRSRSEPETERAASELTTEAAHGRMSIECAHITLANYHTNNITTTERMSICD